MRPSFVLALALLVGCTTRSPIPAIDAGPDAGPPPAPDAGRDAGPRPDSGPPIDDVLIYAHSRDTLYTFSAYTNTVAEIGLFRTPDGAQAPYMLDLAVDSEGVVFTSSDEALWRIDPLTAEATRIGDFGLAGEQLFALSFLAPRGEPPTGRRCSSARPTTASTTRSTATTRAPRRSAPIRTAGARAATS
ncbi:MAG: hypothetical protein M5U28_12230 [Sandaracinaceae bacterium]|nr:hypothetical protein [Sandaracinaceae bacterium]